MGVVELREGEIPGVGVCRVRSQGPLTPSGPLHLGSPFRPSRVFLLTGFDSPGVVGQTLRDPCSPGYLRSVCLGLDPSKRSIFKKEDNGTVDRAPDELQGRVGRRGRGSTRGRGTDNFRSAPLPTPSLRSSPGTPRRGSR